MQNIQKNPMVTVAEAASALNIDERTVRDKLSKEEWKGEKRMIGMKEKWFMYRGELERQLERLRIARPQERMSTQGLDDVFVENSASEQAIDAQTVEVQESAKINSDLNLVIDQVLTRLTEQFSRQLDAEKEVVFALRKELEDKDRQLRLLPDLQKRAEEERKLAEEERQAAELRAVEIEALNKQISAMTDEKVALEAKAAEASELASDLKALKATVEELKKPWWKKMLGS